MRLAPFLGMRILPAAVLTVLGCSSGPSLESSDQDLTGQATQFVDFVFEGEVIANGSDTAKQAATAQLLYTGGALTKQGANGRVGFVALDSVISEPIEGGLQRISYRATLPVGFPKYATLPAEWPVVVPKHVDNAGLLRFTSSPEGGGYNGSCGTAQYGADRFWHDFDPNTEGCVLADKDVLRTVAAVRPTTAVITDGKYPEYDLVWKDNVLQVAAIFGYAENTSNDDVGVEAYEQFVNDMRRLIQAEGGEVVEAVGVAGPAILRDITLSSALGARSIKVHALLIEAPKYVAAAIEPRLVEITSAADLVTYSGHSGLGRNVEPLVRRMGMNPQQYQLLFMNGCDTWVYLDDTLPSRKRALADDMGYEDATGTTYLDVMANVQPAYFVYMADGVTLLARALYNDQTPKSYNEILSEMPSEHQVIAFGEEDNRFTP